MALEKKILVLKSLLLDSSSQNKELSGIARIEKEGDFCELYLSLINASFMGGEYLCCLVDSQKKTRFIRLGSRPSSYRSVLEPSPSLSKGFAIGIAVVKDFIPVAKAFACSDTLSFSVTDLKKAFADKCALDRKEYLSRQKEEEQPCAEQVDNKETDEQKAFETPQEVYDKYNDEAVATENYFQIEENKISKDEDDFDVWLKDDEPYLFSQEETAKSQADDDGAKTQTSFLFGEEYSASSPYYITVKQELDQLFEKFPKEESLKCFFPDSTFVRVYYSEKKYYVAGLINEKNEPKYICYGVPAKYSKQPPKELDGYCSFIPLSVFDLSGEGFWMMFQSAIDGKCIKPKN